MNHVSDPDDSPSNVSGAVSVAWLNRLTVPCEAALHIVTSRWAVGAHGSVVVHVPDDIGFWNIARTSDQFHIMTTIILNYHNQFQMRLGFNGFNSRDYLRIEILIATTCQIVRGTGQKWFIHEFEHHIWHVRVAVCDELPHVYETS